VAAAHRERAIERTIETELVPRMLMAHRGSPVPPGADVAHPVATHTNADTAAADAATNVAKVRLIRDADVEAFLDVVIGTDDTAAPEFVRQLLAEGARVESVYMDLLGPTARELGIRWDDDECSFVDVTVALGRLQSVLRDLSQTFQADALNAADSEGSVLLTCLPGEHHTLGLILVAEFLIRDGFRVLVGAPWSEEDLLQQIRTDWFDVIGFSAGCDSKISGLKREIVRIRAVSRNPNVKILVGGQVFSLEHELVRRVGADGWARDARDAPQIIRELISGSAVVSHSADSSVYESNTGQPREIV
jgi:methanogenic corrinoid protein MtbC1